MNINSLAVLDMSIWIDFEEEYLSGHKVNEKKQMKKRFEDIRNKSQKDIQLAMSVEAYERKLAIKRYQKQRQGQVVKLDRGISLYSWDRKRG